MGRCFPKKISYLFPIFACFLGILCSDKKSSAQNDSLPVFLLLPSALRDLVTRFGSCDYRCAFGEVPAARQVAAATCRNRGQHLSGPATLFAALFLLW